MIEINAALVKQLVAAQFPHWANLPISQIEEGGVDNRTFRLGDAMIVRLPSAAAYAPQVGKEHQWLPVLRSRLPLPIPIPLGLGEPGADYPLPWSVYSWLEGETAQTASVHNLDQFAADLAHFLVALREIDAKKGPIAGAHNFHRGGLLSIFDAQTRASINTLADAIDAAKAMDVWNTALTTSWLEPSVWVHGDIAASNLLVKEGQLCAVIDFGCLGVGDPSCDLVIAWTFLDAASRETFRKVSALDAGTWERARGWAMWKALITLVQCRTSNSIEAVKASKVICAVIDDHSRRSAAGQIVQGQVHER